MRDEEAYREHSCRHSTMDSRRDLNGRGQGAMRCGCAGAGEHDKKIEKNKAREMRPLVTINQSLKGT